jgi:hypothetical protein
MFATGIAANDRSDGNDTSRARLSVLAAFSIAGDRRSGAERCQRVYRPHDKIGDRK